MGSRIKINLNSTLPLGAALLRLRGATYNLQEAISANDHEIILKRRIELSEFVQLLKNTNYELAADSFVVSRLIHNMHVSRKIATSMLREASSYLSAHLVQA